MLLTDAERLQVYYDLLSIYSQRKQDLPGTKQGALDAIAAIDQWVEDNTPSFNNALPLAARQALNPIQKLQLLMQILRQRVAPKQSL